jgi:hypothetical protein
MIRFVSFDFWIHLGDDPVADVGGAHAAEIRVLHYVAGGRTAAPEAAGSFRDFAELPALLERFG